MSNRVAIVGATGLVGEALLQILQQRSFPISELVLLASERSAGQKIEFNGQEHEVRLLDDFDFENIDFSFFSAGATVSGVFAPKALGAKTPETVAPAEKKEKSIFSKSKSSNSLTSCSCPLNSIF